MQVRAAGKQAGAIGSFRAARLTAVALTASALLAGCGSSSEKPATTAGSGTSNKPYVLITVMNDTPSTVEFIQCEKTCAELHERRTIPAGGSNSILGQNDNVPFNYLVKDMSGKRLGCVRMQFDHVSEAKPVHISSMTACK